MFANLLDLKKYFVWNKNKVPISYLYCIIATYLIAAWFSEGYSHADEHYQILEFAAYYIYHYPYAYPWELTAQIRPTLQIWVVIWLYKIASLLSWQISPFMLAFLTRALTGCLSAIGCYVFVGAFQQELNSFNKRKYFLLLSAFSYIAFSCVVRFSSEAVSGALFLFGFSLLFYRDFSKQSVTYFIAGLLLGLAFITRYQVGLMIFGLIAWLVVYQKIKPSKCLLLLIGMVMIGGLGVYLDSLFYGKLTYTAWRYFEVNILQDKVSEFGKSSCLAYLKVSLMLPYGLLFVFSSLFFSIKCPKHVLTWVLVPFILVHCLIGHKELRFLIPILGLMPFILIYTFQLLQASYPSRFTGTRLAALNKPVWILNGFAVFYVTIIAHFDFQTYKYIWAHYQHTPAVLNFIRKGPLLPDNAVLLNMPWRFYMPESLYIHRDVRFNRSLCKQNAICLKWVTCDKKVIRDKQNTKLVFDSCHLYDAMKSHLNKFHWADRSFFFYANARLYEVS